ncbi:MAG: hypothetical protein LUH36_00995 [Oscillospiraceae bacterium]|nr:hypothetical protein [Oscillospiraceae bacterium]
MIIRLFPVKSSLPMTTTMARPAGKISAPAIFPSRAEPMVEAVPRQGDKGPGQHGQQEHPPLGDIRLGGPGGNIAFCDLF